MPNMTSLNVLITKAAAAPKKLFVIDAMGALLSVLLLALVLPMLESWLGFQRNELFFLASIPAFFIVIDLIGATRSPRAAILWVRVIAIANLLYCVISLTTFTLGSTHITPLGWAYVAAEVLLIGAIGAFELACAQKMNEALPHS